MSKSSPKIFMVVGEASGDSLGAELMQLMQVRDSQLCFEGIGGDKMVALGQQQFLTYKDLGMILGFFEVLKHIRYLKKVLKDIEARFKADPPDLVILIDYPGFNLRVAKIAKQLGLKVLFYVGPQIWAWRYKRIHTIKQVVDHIAVLFPFEKKIYESENIPVTVVEHPLVKKVKPSMSKDAAYDYFDLAKDGKIVVVMPGSRGSEIKRLLPLIVKTVAILHKQNKALQFVLPLAPTVDEAKIRSKIKDLPIKIIKDKLYDLLNIANCVVTASGTATLEVALMRVPMTVIYKVSAPTAVMARRMKLIPYCSLCNIVSGKFVVQEYLQENAKAAKVSAEVGRLLDDQPYREKMIMELGALKQDLRDSGTVEHYVDDNILPLLKNMGSAARRDSP